MSLYGTKSKVEQSKIQPIVVERYAEPKPKVTYSDGSENKLLVRIFTGIAFGLVTFLFALALVDINLQILAYENRNYYAVIFLAMSGIAIAWFVVKKLKVITWVLNLNVLFYLIITIVPLSGLRDFHDWTLNLLIFLTLAIALTSLGIRLRLKKVQLSTA